MNFELQKIFDFAFHKISQANYKSNCIDILKNVNKLKLFFVETLIKYITLEWLKLKSNV